MKFVWLLLNTHILSSQMNQTSLLSKIKEKRNILYEIVNRINATF